MNTQTRKKSAARNCTQHPERSRLSGNASHRPGLGSCGRRTPGWGDSTVPHNNLPASVRGCVGVCEAALGPLLRLKGVRLGERDVRDPHPEVRALSPPGGNEWAPPAEPPAPASRLGARRPPAPRPAGWGPGGAGGITGQEAARLPPRGPPSPRALPLKLPRSAPSPGAPAGFPGGRPAFPQPSLRRGEAGAGEPGTDQTGSLKGATEGEVPFIRLRRGPGLSRTRTPVQGLRCCPLRQAQPWVCRAHGRRESPGQPSHFAQPFSSVLGNTYFVRTQIHTSCHLSFFHLHSAMYHARVIALEDSQKISLSEGNDFPTKLSSVCTEAEFRRCTFWRT